MSKPLFRTSPFLLALLLAVAMPARSADDDDDDADEAIATAEIANPPRYPEQALTPQILYQFLLAEIAGQRRQFALSTAAYTDLAKSTRDARIARRATEIGLHSRQFEPALEAARLWVELDPQEPLARQMLAALLVGTQRTDELADALAAELLSAGSQVGDALLRLNRMLARHPDKGAAQRLVERVTTPYLTLPEAHFVRAQAFANIKDGVRALAAIDQALALRPEWEMGALFKAQQMPTGAPLREFLASFVKANPNARDARLAYARALVADSQYELARKEFALLLDAAPDNPDLAYAVGVLSLQLNEVKDAESRLRQVAAAGQGRQDAARFYLGQIAEEAGRIDEALRWYADVPPGEHFAGARVRSAYLLFKAGRLLEARAGLLAARERAVGDAPRLVIAEAQLLRESGDEREAYAFLLRQAEIYVDQPDLVYELGLVAERQGRWSEAERHFRRLIEIRPESSQGYNALGYSLADRNERLDEAEMLIDKALMVAPDDYHILDSKGWVLFRRGKSEEALDYLRRAFAAKPEPEIAAHIGEVLWVLGRRDEARQVWREADAANPGNAELGATIKRFLP